MTQNEVYMDKTRAIRRLLENTDFKLIFQDEFFNIESLLMSLSLEIDKKARKAILRKIEARGVLLNYIKQLENSVDTLNTLESEGNQTQEL
jgi:hypothetical protein